MKNKGLTLAELIVTMAIAFIVAMTLTVLFISEFRLREQINDQIAVTRGARAVIDHASRVLKFASPDSFTVNQGVNPAVENYYSTYGMAIVGGQLESLFPNTNTTYIVRYEYFHDFPGTTIADNQVVFHVIIPQPIPQPFIPTSMIAHYITDFSIVEDTSGDWFTVSVTTQKNNAEITLVTTVRRIGE